MIRPMALAACVAFTAASIQAAAAVEGAETVATAAAPAKSMGGVYRAGLDNTKAMADR